MYDNVLNNTVKPLNIENFRLLKFCPILGGI